MKPTLTQFSGRSALLLIIPIIISSCKREVDRGRLPISNEAEEWLNYSGSETLNFQDSLGNSLKLQGQGSENYFTRQLLRTDPQVLSAKQHYAELERQLTRYQNDSIILTYGLYKQATVTTESDYLSINIRLSSQDVLNAALLISDGTLLKLEKENDFIFEAERVIGGRRFEEVYSFTDEEGDFVRFTKERGLLEFQIKGSEVFFLN